MSEKREQRPLIIELDDTKKELIQCVNNAVQNRGLPCYLIEPLFAELYTQIKVGAQNELAQAKALMNVADDTDNTK